MQIASILLSILASTSVLASKNSPVDVVFSRQCNGNYQVLPKLPFGMAIDVPAFERAFTGAFAKLRDRTKCQCSGLTDNDFDLLFDPITGVLNAASSNTKYPTVPAECAGLFPRNLTDFADASNINLPSTCTLSSWQTSGECSVKYDWSSQIQFGVALKKCPGSRIPAFTVNCIGCTDLAKPCMADSDCGKHKCNSVTPWASHQESVINWYQGFKDIGLFDEGDASPGCSQNKFQPTASNDMLTSVLSFFKNEIYGDVGEVTEIKFCGIDQFTNANMTGLVTVVEHPLTPKRCYAPSDYTTKEITITNLKPWAEGQSVLALPPILPAPNIAPASAGRLRFFQMTCDGQFSMFNGGARVRMGQNYIKTFEKLGRMLYAMQKCRRNGSLMLSQFLTRFGTWTLYPYMYSFDGNSFPDQYDLGPAMSDLVTRMFTRHRIDYPNDPYRPSKLPSFLFGLPDTCNFQHLLKTGACSAQFSGISSLLNVDVQAELHVSTCAASSGDTPMFMQSFAIDMTCGGGEACTQATFTPISCDTSYDCPSNFECMDIKKMFPLPEGFSGDIIGDYFFPLRDTKVEPVGFSGTLCDSSNVGYKSDPTCGGVLKNDQDMSYIFAQFSGMDPAKMSQKGGIKICSFDQQAFNGTTVSNWAMTQIQSKENGIVVANLHPVSPPSELLIGSASPPSDPVTDYPTSNGSILTASTGVGLAAMFFAFMLI